MSIAGNATKRSRVRPSAGAAACAASPVALLAGTFALVGMLVLALTSSGCSSTGSGTGADAPEDPAAVVEAESATGDPAADSAQSADGSGSGSLAGTKFTSDSKPEVVVEDTPQIIHMMGADLVVPGTGSIFADTSADGVSDQDADAATDQDASAVAPAAPTPGLTSAHASVTPVRHAVVSLAMRVSAAAQLSDIAATARQAYADRFIPVANPIDFASLKQTNTDIFAWIEVPGTWISLPVCQSLTDDAYYLTHDETGAYTLYGVPFTQMCSSQDFSDPVTVIYGHNVHVEEYEFTSLHYFENTDFFAANQYFTVYTMHHILTYYIVSAYMYDNRHILNSFDFTNPEVLAGYQAYILNPDSLVRNVREGATIKSTDKILQLSTCMTESEYSGCRWLVTGVLVRDQLTY